MKNTLRKVVAWLAVLLACALATGCWSATELGQLAIVMGIGVDAGSTPGSYLLTAQLARPSQANSFPAQQGPGSKPYLNVQMEGLGVNAALHEMTRQMSRKLYTAHNQVLVLGGDVAGDTIVPVLNYFIRSAEGKFAVRLLIAEGKADGLLREDAGLEQLPAMHLKNLLHSGIDNIYVEDTTLHSFLSELLIPGIAATAPLVSLYTDADGVNRAQVQGSAIFLEGRQIGVLSVERTQAKQLVQGRTKGGYVHLDAFGNDLSLDITASHTTVTARVEDGRVVAAIHVRQEYTLADTGAETGVSRKETIAEIEEIAATRIVAAVEDLIRYTQGFGADVCGLGDMARRKYPEQMKPLLENWPANYANLEVEVIAVTRVVMTGATLRSISPGGGRP